jgi:hypothetical protein
LNPTVPVVFAIVGPLPADQCASALSVLEKVAGLPPGYRSSSRCGNRQLADQVAATYQCRVIDQQSVNVSELQGAIQYGYSCHGLPQRNHPDGCTLAAHQMRNYEKVRRVFSWLRSGFRNINLHLALGTWLLAGIADY